MKETKGEQLTFIAPNGYITPCPFRESCAAYLLEDGKAEDGTLYRRGCAGKTWWCGRTGVKEF